MAETKLKLVKKQKKQISKVADSTPQLAPHSLPALTPAERSEAARFRALTAAKAARQAMLHRIMSELQELDDIQSAA